MPVEQIKVTGFDSRENGVHVAREGLGDPCVRADKHWIKQDGVEGELPIGSDAPTEALIAICVDRLECLSRSNATRSREKSLAITKLEEALHWLAADARHEVR